MISIGTMIISGFSLSIGFWGGRKFTNWLDYHIALMDPLVKKMIREERIRLQQVNQ